MTVFINKISAIVFQKHFLLMFLFWVALFLYSFFLMWHTFSYDQQSHTILISTKAWSDFGAHIPLIRSFSLGENWPPQSPLFPGEPIRYHFGFYFFVGLLERLGVPLDWAINVPSALGFFLLIVSIYLFSYGLFTSIPTAILSVIFFFFNGSLAFVSFFQKHPLSVNNIREIITNSRFSVFGPWDGQDITAFWTLNIYTNQRHLALAYGLALMALFVYLRPKNKTIHTDLLTGILTGIIVTILLFIHHAAAGIAILFLSWMFIVSPHVRKSLGIAGLIVIPWALLLRSLINLPLTLMWKTGYLTHEPFTITGWLSFWFSNIGFHLFFIPLGFFLSPKRVRTILGVPMLILFLVPNLVQFSPDMINNHKFFNFFMIIGSMFSAYALTILFFRFKKIHPSLRLSSYLPIRLSSYLPIRLSSYLPILLFVPLLTLSGFIDFFPVINDSLGKLPDIAVNADAAFFATTPPDSIVLNSTWFYHPASIAGRAIFSGYPYFTWSYGYDKDSHEQIARSIYAAPSKAEACRLLTVHSIDYVEINDDPEYVNPNMTLWTTQFTQKYRNDATGISIFDVQSSCILQ